jgi:hypothetical protein
MDSLPVRPLVYNGTFSFILRIIASRSRTPG